MPGPLPGDTSQTARLLLGAPGYAVGWQERVFLPAPPAGVEWSYAVDGRYFERLVLARFTFTADAVVANRAPQLRLLDADGAVVTVVPVSGAIAAGGSVSVNASVGAPVFSAATGGDTATYLPDLLVPPGWSWVSHVVAADPGDTRTGIVLVTQRYPTDTAAVVAAS